MRTLRICIPIILAAMVFAVGCSQGASPVDPDVREPIDLATSEMHGLLGLYTFVCDPEEGTLEVISLRESEMHLNALKVLEPPANLFLTFEGPPTFNGNILDIDIGLRNPFLGMPLYTGFDVCGIVFTHGTATGFNDPEIIMAGKGDARLINADGYTRWWNPVEFPHGATIFNYIDGMLGTHAEHADFNCTINGYKYFADGLDKDESLTHLNWQDRGVFSSGQKNVRHYKIDISDELIFNYAVDACWKKPQGGPPYTVPDDFPPEANRQEAYNIVITEIENSLMYIESVGVGSGELKLSIKVYDHYGSDLNDVSVESPDVGIPFTTTQWPIDWGQGNSTYEITLPGDDLIKNGSAELLITVETEITGYGGALLGKPVSTYFKYPFLVKGHLPLGWARTWGSAGDDKCSSVAVDADGGIYITGTFPGTVDFDPGPGVDERINEAGDDVFLSKFDLDGDFQWVRTWGGLLGDFDDGVASIDGLGNVYVTGGFSGTVDLDPGSGVDEHSSGNGGRNTYLSKFDTNGNYYWGRTWGYYDSSFNGNVRGLDVVSVDSGDIYVTGYFDGFCDFDPGPGLEIHSAAGYDDDIFLSKFISNGDFQWVRTWGGSDKDQGKAVTVFGQDYLYVVGTFENEVDFDPGLGVVKYSAIDGHDAFINAFDSNGGFLWAHTWDAAAYDVATDNSGLIYIVGAFKDISDFDPGPSVDLHTAEGGDDVFISKLDSSGDFLWARTWGGLYGDVGEGIVADDYGNICLTGWFMDAVDFDPGPEVDKHLSTGIGDIFLSKFNQDGNYIWGRNWGSEGRDWGTGISVDIYGDIYVSGFFVTDVDFDPGPDKMEYTSVGDDDCFVSKMPSDGIW